MFKYLLDELIILALSIEKILEVGGGGGHSSKFDDLQESQTCPLSFIEYQWDAAAKLKCNASSLIEKCSAHFFV